MFVPVLQRMRDGIDALIGLELPSTYTKQSGSTKISGDP
jgi:hypothetical protein